MQHARVGNSSEIARNFHEILVATILTSEMNERRQCLSSVAKKLKLKPVVINKNSAGKLNLQEFIGCYILNAI